MELSIQERLKDLRVERSLTLEQLAAVSYTHLWLTYSGLMASTVNSAICFTSSCLRPVSYTHLDVYKRQVDDRARLRQLWTRLMVVGDDKVCLLYTSRCV